MPRSLHEKTSRKKSNQTPTTLPPPSPASSTVFNSDGSRVAVCVSPNEGTKGAGVIRITTYTRGEKEVVRHYLIQIVTTFKVVLISFKRDGGNVYTVSLKDGNTHCDCESWGRGKGTTDCKHIKALQALIAHGEL